MRFFPTLAHGVIHHIVGAVLFMLPLLVNFGPGMATWLPVLMGAVVLSYGFATDFELGAVKLISMRTHLILDAVAGLVLLVSPWLVHYAGRAWLVPIVVGCIELGTALVTKTTPFYGPELPARPPVV